MHGRSGGYDSMIDFFEKTKGSISLFLALIMLPMMTVAGLIVDGARISAAKASLSGAGDLAMNAALSEYDQILYDVYGIFAVSENMEELQNNVSRYKTWTAEEVAAIVANQGEFTFDIPGDSTGAHQVKIVCTDAAGNEQTEEITNFYVTTNLFVRYYNNTPLFFGSIAAVVVIAGVVIALAAGKKKKNDKEK